MADSSQTATIPSPESTAELLPEESPWPVSDQNAVMAGICFESAYDAADQVFVLRDAAELTRFFDLADNSQLCRRPVLRQSFDFSDGRVLVGVWSKGRGCSAIHHRLAFHQNDPARTIAIQLQLEISGTCDYDLIRPFWISLDAAADYAISIVVE